MMTRIFPGLAVLVALAAGPAFPAALHELSQKELRQNIAAGKSMSLSDVMKGVARAVPGEAVDVRAFEMGSVYFHVLVMRPTGQLVSVVVDAATGRIASNGSSQAKAVRNAARGGGSSAGGASKMPASEAR